MPLFQRRNDETAACRGVEIRKKVSNRGFALEETRGSSFLRLQEESSTQEFKPNNKELAIQRVNFLFSESALLKSSAGWKFPTFSRKELVLRRTLGRGSFSIVEEIRAMVFCPSTAYRRSDSVAENDKESRQFIAQHCIRSSGDARYAIKSLRQDVLGDPDRCWAGITDLIVEAHFLRHLEHPHIIKLRGVARCDPYSKNYFLILDRLYCTLSTRLREWKAKQGRLHSPLGFLFDPLRKASKSLLHERLIAAYHLSSAFAYLHSNNILHRDCKPENVGFDIRDDIKLFDFGLAREVTAKDSNGDGTYKLSHMTGSLRYMAPEVYARGKTYSSSCDVYSFALLLWQMLALDCPFFHIQEEIMFIQHVFKKGLRPPLKTIQSKACRELLTKSWAPLLNDRPPMDVLANCLRQEASELQFGKEEDYDLQRRRSTFVFKSAASEVDDAA